jgi:hypothetical protein
MLLEGHSRYLSVTLRNILQQTAKIAQGLFFSLPLRMRINCIIDKQSLIGLKLRTNVEPLPKEALITQDFTVKLLHEETSS